MASWLAGFSVLGIYLARMAELRTKRNTVSGQVRETRTLQMVVVAGTMMLIGGIGEHFWRQPAGNPVLFIAGWACAAGSFRPTCYCVLQILPNFLVALFRSDGDNFHCCIQQFVPVAHDRTLFRAWVYPAPFPVEGRWHARLWRHASDPVRNRLVQFYASRVIREDNMICEGVQTVAHQIERPPYLADLEERIGWFEQSYRELVAGGEELLREVSARDSRKLSPSPSGPCGRGTG